jgi:chemotaxis protein methyltransferase CheR
METHRWLHSNSPRAHLTNESLNLSRLRFGSCSLRSWDINILGTDISDEVVARASRGWYAPDEIERGLSPARLHRFFQSENNGWRVKDSLRSMCSFERRNVLDPHSAQGRFDVIFCRNVAIYFTAEARKDLFLRLSKALTPGGWLFVGGQQSLRDLGPQFAPQQHCRAICYRPNQALVVAR